MRATKDFKYAEAFGRRLQAVRLAAGVKNADKVAKLLGVARLRYRKWENGISEAPYEYLIKLSDMFRVSIDYLVAGRVSVLDNVVPAEPPQPKS